MTVHCLNAVCCSDLLRPLVHISLFKGPVCVWSCNTANWLWNLSLTTDIWRWEQSKNPQKNFSSIFLKAALKDLRKVITARRQETSACARSQPTFSSAMGSRGCSGSAFPAASPSHSCWIKDSSPRFCFENLICTVVPHYCHSAPLCPAMKGHKMTWERSGGGRA